MSRGWSPALAAGLLASTLTAGACGGDWATRTLHRMSLRQKATLLVMPRIDGGYVPGGTLTGVAPATGRWPMPIAPFHQIAEGIGIGGGVDR